MKTYISILRGINVSGHNPIKMKDLQVLYEEMGFNRVKTYIQSGNVVFGYRATETEKLEEIISGEIRRKFGYQVPVIVTGHDQLKIVSENNPFLNDRNEDALKLHVTFLSAEPEVDLPGKIDGSVYMPDEYIIAEKTIYLFCPNGYGNTKLSNTFFEKKLKVQATTRNWKTVLELVKMSQDSFHACNS